MSSYTEISYKHVIGRKDYRCEWCDQLIPKGEKQMYRAYHFEGDFNTGRMHLECEVAMDKSDRELISEGWLPGDCKRGELMGDDRHE